MEQEKNKIIVRQPVVVIMGHVDHGKSSLLEAIREGFVICAKESGGITQHIGAYEVEVGGNPPSPKATDGQRKITFIDTPGHEAFSAMRSRGANLADIAILVIDAAEGLKPQTKEALNFIKKAKIPMIVAFNKIDKPEADPEKVKRDLSQIDVLVESYGGQVPSCEVSAKTKQGIKELLETISLVAEMEELKCDLSLPVQGIVIESSLDPQKGPIATLLVKQGLLREGDVVATENVLGKLRHLANFQNKRLNEVLPGQPARVLGFEQPPAVGDVFKVFANHEQARTQLKTKTICAKPPIAIKNNSDKEIKTLNIILKTDFLGSCEALVGVLENIPRDKVVLNFIKTGVGDINASDILLAENSHAVVLGFRVKTDENTSHLLRERGIKAKTFDVIYELAQEARRLMTATLSPETKRVNTGKFKAIIIFKQDKNTQIVGGKVLEGEITRNVKAEIMRDDEIIGHGKVKGLQKDKKDIGKAEKGQEVGILLQSEIKTQENDILVFFSEEKERATLWFIMATEQRVKRINELLKRQIGQTILEEVDFPKNILVTVSGVETSQDVTHCKVSIAVFPASETKNALAILQKFIYPIQKLVNKSLRMRPVPQIRFVEEKDMAPAQRVEAILENIKIEEEWAGYKIIP